MVAFYIDQIKQGFMEVENVPKLWKPKVEKELQSKEE